MESFSLENFDVYLDKNDILKFVWNGDSFNTSIKELERIIEWVKQNTTTYEPPYTIFNLVPYKDNVGEQVICVDDYCCNKLKIGEVFTIIEQMDNYVRIDKYKDYPNMRFSSDRFKKLKAVYDGKEYMLLLK